MRIAALSYQKEQRRERVFERRDRVAAKPPCLNRHIVLQCSEELLERRLLEFDIQLARRHDCDDVFCILMALTVMAKLFDIACHRQFDTLTALNFDDALAFDSAVCEFANIQISYQPGNCAVAKQRLGDRNKGFARCDDPY